MMAPDTPAREHERLAVLHSYEVLDSDAEANLDALTRLASIMVGTPIALVSLVDAKRQWFKSRVGLAVTETPREVSFCGHVVASGCTMVVPDTTLDPRFVDNPLVTGEPKIRFYAGVPLRTPEGFVLGTLCAIDRVPRDASPEQLEALDLLARQVMELLDARRERKRFQRERDRARAVVRELEAVFDAMIEGVVVQDDTGRIVRWNRSAERILGLTGEQLSGRTSYDPRWRAVHEDGSDFAGDAHPAMVAQRTREPVADTVMGVQKPDGSITWIRIAATPLEGVDGERSVLTTFYDITALKAAQAASELLARKERLITTGTLAAGVGHEINNPLAYMLGNIEFALEELRAIAGGSPSGRMREIAGALLDAREGGERVRKIVRGLRALAREEADATSCDVASAIEISANMAAHEIRHKASLRRTLKPVPHALIDESQLSQVLVNLLVNAAQAFDSGNLDRNRIEVSTWSTPDDRVWIEVRDNGPGIPPELRRRVFDPFFTTKPVGQGTGLGLSITQSIVHGSGGEITMESVVGEGTVFRIALPVAHVPAPVKVSGRPAEAGNRGRVLVVDDETPILLTIQRMLAADHEVTALAAGRDALDLLLAGVRFDVIFCDVMMPHMSGIELFDEVRRALPHIASRFVFLTGGATNPTVLDFLGTVANERLDKPFTVQGLRALVRRYVEGGSLAPAEHSR